MLDEGASACTASSGRPVDAVQQLADRDHADCTLLLTDQSFEHLGALLALPLDQQARVDPDGQGFSGAEPDSRRICRRSSAKSSTTGGAEAISSRNRAAGSRRVRGGAMTATGAPLRITSISSPVATRFRTSEKLRATSVAVKRVTSRFIREIRLEVSARLDELDPVIVGIAYETES